MTLVGFFFYCSSLCCIKLSWASQRCWKLGELLLPSEQRLSEQRCQRRPRRRLVWEMVVVGYMGNGNNMVLHGRHV
jgi:hypothetical protein